MRYYDVFNGDADGICALHQLLRTMPAGDGDVVTVLDISLDRLEEARLEPFLQQFERAAEPASA